MADILTREESRVLLELCRAGRLYDIEKWIASGKSLRVPIECKKTALQVALETGFHSLVELIARHESDQAAKNAALREAVEHARLDLVELLLANGADLRSVSFLRVLLSWDPRMIRFFLAEGADAFSGAPFAQAFEAKIRTAIGPFLEYKRAHPELAEQLQGQLDSALRHFCREGSLKWVSLLLWAGANPRTKGPVVGKDYTNEPENFTTGLEEACYADSVDVLKKLKPDPSRDDLTLLLRRAAFMTRKEAISYLLALGANPNDQANGGSTALASCLADFRFGLPNSYSPLRPLYSVSCALGCTQVLVEHGAQWRPNSPEEMKWIRRALLECEADVTIEVLKLFTIRNACSKETM